MFLDGAVYVQPSNILLDYDIVFPEHIYSNLSLKICYRFMVVNLYRNFC
jgi:hypothetical protein